MALDDCKLLRQAANNNLTMSACFATLIEDIQGCRAKTKVHVFCYGGALAAQRAAKRSPTLM